MVVQKVWEGMTDFQCQDSDHVLTHILQRNERLEYAQQVTSPPASELTNLM